MGAGWRSPDPPREEIEEWFGPEHMAAAAGLRLHTSVLQPFSHWVTPLGLPKRFDTMFYVCRAPEGQDARADESETTAIAWVHPSAALEAHRDELQDVTVVSYCTGGIRCEKAAILMQDLGLTNSWQLEGGILQYFEQTGGRQPTPHDQVRRDAPADRERRRSEPAAARCHRALRIQRSPEHLGRPLPGAGRARRALRSARRGRRRGSPS